MSQRPPLECDMLGFDAVSVIWQPAPQNGGGWVNEVEGGRRPRRCARAESQRLAILE
jgi:hypothetical protein